jgi:outer membrane protein assembly factor BamA
MKCLLATLLATTVLLAPYGRAVAFQLTDQTNVNSRYRIEKISVQSAAAALSRGLQREIDHLIGRPFRSELIDEIERKIRSEFPGFKVVRTVSRGEKQDQIRVLFILERTRKIIDLNSTRLAYHSKQNFSLGAGIDWQIARTNWNFGFVSDNDEKVERYTGFRGGFGVPLARDGKVRFQLVGETFRSQWRNEESPEFYRARMNVEPSIVVELARGLELRAGMSFNKLEYQLPVARIQAANAVITNLRYVRQSQLGSTGTQTLEAGYSLRAAANSFGSDFSYQRHVGESKLTLISGKNSVQFSALVGGIDGNAPVLDRFVLGNTRTLRGWNKFELAPLGANRMAHFSTDLRSGVVRAVYDTGTIWNPGRPMVLRHSAGLGFVVSGITAMVAIPIRSSSIEPIFLVGMNF